MNRLLKEDRAPTFCVEVSETGSLLMSCPQPLFKNFSHSRGEFLIKIWQHVLCSSALFSHRKLEKPRVTSLDGRAVSACRPELHWPGFHGLAKVIGQLMQVRKKPKAFPTLLL